MKIYNRENFLKLPSGTIFCQGEKWYWNQISVKSDTFGNGNDFLFSGLTDIEANDSGGFFDILGEMCHKGVSYPLDPEGYVRDGMYNEKAIFLVYEKEDLEALIKIFQRARDNE